MATIRITSARGGWSADVFVKPNFGTPENVVRHLKSLAPGITGQILPGGIVEIFADDSVIPVDKLASLA